MKNTTAGSIIDYANEFKDTLVKVHAKDMSNPKSKAKLVEG